MHEANDIVNSVVHDSCENVMGSLCDGSIDLIVTDPPYGIDYQSHRQNWSGNHGESVKTDREFYFDKIANDDFVPVEWLSEAYRVLKEGSAIYLFCHWSKWSEIEASVRGAGFIMKNMIVINKSNHGMGDLKGSYAPKHELLLYAAKQHHILNFPKRQSDVWNMKVKYSHSVRFHPNEKPVDWVVPPILNSSLNNDLVLDPFAGSGSTLVAAKRCGRKYIGVEVDASYCDIARNRLSEPLEEDIFNGRLT